MLCWAARPQLQLAAGRQGGGKGRRGAAHGLPTACSLPSQHCRLAPAVPACRRGGPQDGLAVAVRPVRPPGEVRARALDRRGRGAAALERAGHGARGCARQRGGWGRLHMRMSGPAAAPGSSLNALPAPALLAARVSTLPRPARLLTRPAAPARREPGCGPPQLLHHHWRLGAGEAGGRGKKSEWAEP